MKLLQFIRTELAPTGQLVYRAESSIRTIYYITPFSMSDK